MAIFAAAVTSSFVAAILLVLLSDDIPLLFLS